MQVRMESMRWAMVVAGALLAGATAASAQETTPTPAPTPAAAPAAVPAASACTLTLDPQSLKPQADAFHVRATLSQSIGDAMSANIQEPNSGIDVSLMPAGASANAKGPSAKKGKKGAAAAQAAPATGSADASMGQVVDLRLATGAAKAGDYTVDLKGATGSCSGKITLEGAAAGQKP